MKNFYESNSHSDKSISPIDLLISLRRRGWVLVACLVGSLIPILIYNHKAAPIFRASTEVIFEESEKVMASQLRYSSYKGRENFILNQIEEMKTKTFAKEVYDSLPTAIREHLVFERSRPTEASRVDEIRGHLNIMPTKGTEIVKIRFEARDPAVAQIVANTAAEVLINRNLEMRRQKYSNVKKFIDQQFTVVKKRLQNAESALKQFKKQNNISSLEAETKEILHRVTQAEILYNQVGSENQELQEKVNILKTKLNQEKKDLAKNIVKTSNPLLEGLRERLVELEVQYSNLLVQGIPHTNPKMLDIQNEIAQIKRNLVNETMKINRDENLGSFLDPFSQIRRYVEELIGLEADLQAQDAKEANLRSLLAGYTAKLRNLPEKEMTLWRLMRDRESNNKMYLTLLEEREKARIKEAAEIGDIRVIEPARLPEEAVRPRWLLNVIIGIFSGLIVGTLLIAGLEYISNDVKTEEEVEAVLGLSVLASIPRLKHDFSFLLHPLTNGDMAKNNRNEAIFGDEYNLLYSALTKQIHGPSTIMVTSCVPHEGKSTMATMLAATTAQRGKRTLLVDGDFRKPTLHSIFCVSKEPGLTNLVVDFMQISKRSEGPGNHAQKEDRLNITQNPRLQRSLQETITQTVEKKLLFLPCGFIPANPVRAWSASIWSTIFAQLKCVVDVIIIDAPPIVGIPDPAIISTYADHILFCVESGGVDASTLFRSFRSFKNAIKDSEDKIVGAVLNKVDLYGKYKYYHYYSKNYGSRATSAVV